jgi:hypothetical protein
MLKCYMETSNCNLRTLIGGLREARGAGVDPPQEFEKCCVFNTYLN